MTRILLVIDDYNEMIYLQTLLKRLGVDVEALNNSRSFSETLLGFNPKLLIMTAHGKKINGLQLAQNVTKRKGIPSIMLLKSASQFFKPHELDDPHLDLVLDSPVNVLQLIKAVATLCELNIDQLTEKLHRVMAPDEKTHKESSTESSKSTFTDSGNDAFMVSGSPDEQIEFNLIKGEKKKKAAGGEYEAPVYKLKTTIDEKQREKNYSEYLKKVKDAPQGKGGFERSKIKGFNRQHRVEERTEEMKDLDDEKKSFVKALYSHLK